MLIIAMHEAWTLMLVAFSGQATYVSACAVTSWPLTLSWKGDVQSLNLDQLLDYLSGCTLLLADFWLVVRGLKNLLSFCSTAVGTPGYMAPEVMVTSAGRGPLLAR